MMSETSIDKSEIYKFNKNLQEWWDEYGEFKILHRITPLRIEYILKNIKKYFDIKDINKDELSEIELIDIGSGGGLTCEPLAKMGIKVTGIDANESNIIAASQHAQKSDLKINYLYTTVEEHIKSKKKYDVVICLEVIEHVANQEEFIKNVGKMVNDRGILIFSTINKNFKSYCLVIGMAEYIIGLVPKGTHDFSKFVKPSFLSNNLSKSNLQISELKGLSSFDLKNWYLSEDISLNYFALFTNKPRN